MLTFSASHSMKRYSTSEWSSCNQFIYIYYILKFSTIWLGIMSSSIQSMWSYPYPRSIHYHFQQDGMVNMIRECGNSSKCLTDSLLNGWATLKTFYWWGGAMFMCLLPGMSSLLSELHKQVHLTTLTSYDFKSMLPSFFFKLLHDSWDLYWSI